MSRAITSARMRRSVVLAACCGILIAGFLLRPAPPASDALDAATARVVRPGDSLLDREFLDRAVVERLPRTNLPADLIEVARGPLPFRTEPLTATSWKGPSEIVDSRFRSATVPAAMKSWTTVVTLRADTTAGPVRFFSDGRELAFPALDELAGRQVPDPYLYWDPEAYCVRAQGRFEPLI